MLKLTQGALTHLVRQYRSVLARCRTLNHLAGLVLAGALLLAPQAAWANTTLTEDTTIDSETASSYTLSGSSGENGGALSIYSSSDTVTTTMSGLTLSGNSATLDGGAIYSRETLVLSGMSFESNTTVQYGGAIYSSGTLTVSDSTFSGNTSTSAEAGWGGGAIFSKGSLTLTDVTFTGNSAGRNGGALCVFVYTWNDRNIVDGITASTTIAGTTTFTNNSAVYGGAIYNDRADLALSGTVTFDGNTAENGGALNNYNAAVTIREGAVVTFAGNSTTGAVSTDTSVGGAIRNNRGSYSTSITVEEGATVSFEKNSSADDGGAIWNSGTVTQNGTAVFAENSASGNGGAICNTGTFTLGGTNTFSGNSAAGDGGAIYNAGTLNITGTVILETASDTICNSGSGTITVTGTIAGDSASLTNQADFIVDGGTVSLASAALESGSLTLTSGALAVIEDLGASSFGTGSISVGTGSILALGGSASLASLSQTIRQAGIVTSSSPAAGDRSVLALGSAVSLGATSLALASESGADGGVSFGQDSILAMDSAVLDTAASSEADLTAKTAAISTDGSLSVTSGATLVVTNISGTGLYSIASAAGGIEADSAAWNGEDLVITLSGDLQAMSASDLVTIDCSVEGTDSLLYLRVSASQESIGGGEVGQDGGGTSRMDTDLVRLADNAVAAGLTDEDSSSFGERFINRAVNRSATRETARRTIEGAARMGQLAAIPQQLLSLSAEAGRMTRARTAFSGLSLPQGGVSELSGEGLKASGLSGGDEYKNGFALWIAPMYKHLSGADFAAGDYDAGFNTDMGGLMLGMDWTFDSSLRLGVQLNMGGGYTTSTGSFADTTNSFSWWGAGLYGGCRVGNFGINADAGVTSSYNKMSQDLDTALGMGSELEADARAESYTFAVNFEYRVETDVLDIIPHAGARYTALHVYGYDTEAQGQTVLSSDDIWAHVWQFPVGVTLTKDFVTESGWTISPRVDFAVIPAAGDLETKQDVSFHGLSGQAELEGDIMDAWTGQGQAGITFSTGTGLSFGVDYTFQASRHQTSHGLQGMLRYEF